MSRFESCRGHQTGQIKIFFGLSCFIFDETRVQRVYQLNGLIDPSGSLAHRKTGIPKQSTDEGPAHGGRVRPYSYFIPVDFTKANVS